MIVYLFFKVILNCSKTQKLAQIAIIEKKKYYSYNNSKKKFKLNDYRKHKLAK